MVEEHQSGDRVTYDMDGKLLDHVAGDFHFWPSPHGGRVPLREKPVPSKPVAWRCTRCGQQARTLQQLDQINCLEHQPCPYCGLRGICATDCRGVIGLLQARDVYLAGQPIVEKPN